MMESSGEGPDKSPSARDSSYNHRVCERLVPILKASGESDLRHLLLLAPAVWVGVSGGEVCG